MQSNIEQVPVDQKIEIVNTLSKPSKLPMFLVGIVVLLFVAGIAFAAGYMVKDNNQLTPTPLISVTPSGVAITNTKPTEIAIENATQAPLENTKISNATPIVQNQLTQIALNKEFQIEVLDTLYTFKYQNQWQEFNKINSTNMYSVTLKPNASDDCSNGTAICSVVFNVGSPAEMLDQAVSTKLRAENITIERDGSVELSSWKYNNTNEHFLYLGFSKGFFLVNVAKDKDQEAINQFKVILNSFYYDESPNAM